MSRLLDLYDFYTRTGRQIPLDVQVRLIAAGIIVSN